MVTKRNSKVVDGILVNGLEEKINKIVFISCFYISEKCIYFCFRLKQDFISSKIVWIQNKDIKRIYVTTNEAF